MAMEAVGKVGQHGPLPLDVGSEDAMGTSRYATVWHTRYGPYDTLTCLSVKKVVVT